MSTRVLMLPELASNKTRPMIDSSRLYDYWRHNHWSRGHIVLPRMRHETSSTPRSRPDDCSQRRQKDSLWATACAPLPKLGCVWLALGEHLSRLCHLRSHLVELSIFNLARSKAFAMPFWRLWTDSCSNGLHLSIRVPSSYPVQCGV